MVEWLALIVAAGALIAAVFYPRRQAQVAAEARDIAAAARDEAKRSADAAAESAREAKRIADIEAGRDHLRALDDIEPVAIETRFNAGRGGEDLVVSVRNRGHRTFKYRATIFHTPNSFSELRSGTWEPDEVKEFFPGTARQEFSHIAIWLDGTCPCTVPDGGLGHWRRVIALPRPLPASPVPPMG